MRFPALVRLLRLKAEEFKVVWILRRLLGQFRIRGREGAAPVRSIE